MNKCMALITATTLLLQGCVPLIFAGVGSSVVVDQCVEREAEACEKANEALQGDE